MVNKRKKYNARFAPARIKKIMQKDEEIGKVAAAVPVIISRALEMFVESLVKKAEGVTRARNAKTLTPAHLKSSILTDPRLYFLRETVSTVPDVIQDDDGEPSSQGMPMPPNPSSMNPGHHGKHPSLGPGPEPPPVDYHHHHLHHEQQAPNGSYPPYPGYYGMPESPYPDMTPPYGIPNAHSGPPMGMPPQSHMQNPAMSPYAPYLPAHAGQYPPVNYAPASNPAFSHFGSGYPMPSAVPCQGEEDQLRSP